MVKIPGYCHPKQATGNVARNKWQPLGVIKAIEPNTEPAWFSAQATCLNHNTTGLMFVPKGQKPEVALFHQLMI